MGGGGELLGTSVLFHRRSSFCEGCECVCVCVCECVCVWGGGGDCLVQLSVCISSVVGLWFSVGCVSQSCSLHVTYFCVCSWVVVSCVCVCRQLSCPVTTLHTSHQGAFIVYIRISHLYNSVCTRIYLYSSVQVYMPLQ